MMEPGNKLRRMKKIIYTVIIIAIQHLTFNIQDTHGQAPFNTPDNKGAGNCLDFDGSNDYVDCGDLGGIGTTYSAEMWVNFDDVTSGGHLLTYVRNGGGTTAHNAISISNANGQITFRVRDGSGNNAVITGGSLNVGQWYHIVGVRNGNNTELYIDGELIGTASATFNPIISNQCGIGGVWHDALNRWVTFADGKIDEVRIWNSVRSQAQIRDNMCLQLTGSETGLIAYWNMDEGTGASINDGTSNNNDGTLN